MTWLVRLVKLGLGAWGHLVVAEPGLAYTGFGLAFFRFRFYMTILPPLLYCLRLLLL